MAYVVILLGLVLIGLSGPQAWRQWREDRLDLIHRLEAERDHLRRQLDELAAQGKKTPVVENMETLQEQVGLLTENIADAMTQLNRMEQKMVQLLSTGKPLANNPFGQELTAAQQNAFFQEVYKAYDQGKDITEIAKQFGKGKGEIQLILGLRR